MSKILITYGTRSLAQRIGKIAQQTQDVLFATCEEIPSILSDKFLKIPHGSNPVYAHELLKLSLDRTVDYVLPLEPSECAALSSTRVLFEEYGINVLLPTDLIAKSAIRNPDSTYPMALFHDGESLWSEANERADKSGLYALVNDDWHWVTL